jgi:hypothetical protein
MAGSVEVSGVELNPDVVDYLSGVTPGTASASKALILGADKDVDVLNVGTLGVGANDLAMSGSVRAGQHTVSAGEAAAHTVSIATGITSAVAQTVQIIRAGDVVTGDAAVSFSAGDIVVADGGANYVLTENDVINWIIVGA